MRDRTSFMPTITGVTDVYLILGDAVEPLRPLAARITAATQCCARAVPSNDPAGFDLVINASPLGMKPGDVMPCEVSQLGEGAAVMDIVMRNQPTPWVRGARARGLNAQPGFEMLIQQTPFYLDFFGFAQAALAVRQDATLLRENIYPRALHKEIRRVQPGSLAPVLSLIPATVLQPVEETFQ